MCKNMMRKQIGFVCICGTMMLALAACGLQTAPSSGSESLSISTSDAAISSSDITPESASAPADSSQTALLNPAVSGTDNSTPARVHIPGDYSDCFNNYAKTRAMADDMMAYFHKDVSPDAYGGIYTDIMAAPNEPYGISRVHVWVANQRVVETALEAYPWEKPEDIIFYETACSLYDMNKVIADVGKMPISKSEGFSTWVDEEKNKLHIVMMNESSKADLEALHAYVAGCRIKDYIEVSVYRTTNPVT